MLFFMNWECTRLSSKKMWCLCFRRGWSRSLLQWSVETWLSVRSAHRWCGQVTTDALCWHGSWFPSSGDDNVWRCLSEVGIILVRCKILTFYDQRKRTPNLYEFFFLLLWPFGVYSFIFSTTSSPEGWASGVSCACGATHHWVQEWIQHGKDEDDLTTISVSQYFTDRPLPLMSVLT